MSPRWQAIVEGVGSVLDVAGTPSDRLRRILGTSDEDALWADGEAIGLDRRRDRS